MISILDHAAQATARLLLQYRDKPKLVALVAALGEQAQSLETALQAMVTDRLLATAVGEQLDVLGRLVGQPRGGVTDDTVYRAHVTARIAVNRAHGTVNEILATVVPLVAALVPSADVQLFEQYPAGFAVRLVGAVTSDDTADFLITFLRPLKPAGVNGLLEWYPALPAALLTWAGSSGQAWDAGKWGNAKSF